MHFRRNRTGRRTTMDRCGGPTLRRAGTTGPPGRRGSGSCGTRKGSTPIASVNPPVRDEESLRSRAVTFWSSTGLQMLVDHLHLDSSKWTIKQLVYNGQGPFRNASDLQAAYDCGFICADCLPVRMCSVCSYTLAIQAGCRQLSKISVQAPNASTPEKPLFSSMRRRGPIRYLDERPIPPIAPPPAGERFAVKGNQASCRPTFARIVLAPSIG
jgi:hypothetical protein